MLLECESCGAPLDVPDGVATVRCHYCGRSAAVAQYRTVAQQTPQGFVPPKQWTPPSTSSVPGRPLAYRPRRRGGAGAFVSFMTLAVGGVVAWRIQSAVQSVAAPESQMTNMVGQALSVVSSAVDFAAKARQAAGQRQTGDTLPIFCKGIDEVTISGKTLALPAGVPVVATGNCTLRLVGCAVSGATAVTASGNASVTVEGGSLAGKGPAVVLADNAKLDVSEGARLSGEVTITATGNSTAHVRASSVSGAHVAIHTSGNATVDTVGSQVQGQVLGAHRGRK